MSESQLNKYDEEVKRLEDELNLVQKAIPTLAAAEKCVLRPPPRPSPVGPRLRACPRSLSLAHPPTARPAARARFFRRRLVTEVEDMDEPFSTSPKDANVWISAPPGNQGCCIVM
jgi:hypothetical protein